MKIYAALAFLLLSVPTMAQQSQRHLSEDTVSDSELIVRLREGGLIIIFRHGETGPTPNREDVVQGLAPVAGSAREKHSAYLDCDRQRVLSVEGRQEMVAVAESMRRIGIVLSEVLASPLCRTRNTAWILAGQVVPSAALIGDSSETRSKLVSAEPSPGTNRLLVSHGYVVAGLFGDFDRMAGHEFAPRGHAFVLDPGGDGSFTLLARLGPDDWARLADLAIEW